MTNYRKGPTGAYVPADRRLEPESARRAGDEYAWWFAWEQDEDPLTFWDRRLKSRKNNDGKRNHEEPIE